MIVKSRIEVLKCWFAKSRVIDETVFDVEAQVFGDENS